MHLPSSLASVVDAPLLPHHRVSPQLVFTSARCPSPVACQISCLLGPLLTGYCRSDDVLHAGISSAHTYLPSGLAIALRSPCCRKQWKLLTAHALGAARSHSSAPGQPSGSVEVLRNCSCGLSLPRCANSLCSVTLPLAHSFSSTCRSGCGPCPIGSRIRRLDKKQFQTWTLSY